MLMKNNSKITKEVVLPKNAEIHYQYNKFHKRLVVFLFKKIHSAI